jgi:hypothetical protein
VSPQEAAVARKEMRERGVLYGSRESYHHMCRYFSGFIHKHPLLKEYDYYWRMEPDVHYYCDLDYDPFLYMQVCCAVLCCAVLCCAVLCCAVLCCALILQELLRESDGRIGRNSRVSCVTLSDT